MSKKTYTAKEAEKINKVLEALGMMEITKGGVDFVKPIKAGDTKKTTKKSAGMTVGKANYPGKKKPQEGPMYDPRKTTVKPKKKTVKKKSGGSVGTHNRLY